MMPSYSNKVGRTQVAVARQTLADQFGLCCTATRLWQWRSWLREMMSEHRPACDGFWMLADGLQAGAGQSSGLACSRAPRTGGHPGQIEVSLLAGVGDVRCADV